MREILNCPNCGAPITAVKCPYCGTIFYDFTSIDIDKPAYLRVNGNGQQNLFKARLDSCTFTMSVDALPTVRMDFVILPDDKGIYMAIQEYER